MLVKGETVAHAAVSEHAEAMWAINKIASLQLSCL